MVCYASPSYRSGPFSSTALCSAFYSSSPFWLGQSSPAAATGSRLSWLQQGTCSPSLVSLPSSSSSGVSPFALFLSKLHAKLYTPVIEAWDLSNAVLGMIATMAVQRAVFRVRSFLVPWRAPVQFGVMHRRLSLRSSFHGSTSMIRPTEHGGLANGTASVWVRPLGPNLSESLLSSSWNFQCSLPTF